MRISSLRTMTLALAAWLMLAGVCFGKQLYLKDGGIIEYESAWRRGDLVTVKINRDTVIDLKRSEVDVKRSFAAPRKATPARRAKPAAAAASHGGEAPAAEGAALPVKALAAAPASAQPPAAQPAPIAAPAAKKEPPAAAPVAAPAAAPVAAAGAPAAAPADQAVQPEPPAPSPAAPDRAEAERRMREASEMVAEAVRKQDPELLKKALEAQNSAAQLARQSGAAPEGLPKAPPGAGKILLIALLFVLLTIASMWMVFKKAGRSGVASIVPIYNMYVLLQISGKPGWWLILLIVPGVGFVFHLLAMLSLAQRFERGILYGLGLVLLPMFFFPMLGFGDAQYRYEEVTSYA